MPNIVLQLASGNIPVVNWLIPGTILELSSTSFRLISLLLAVTRTETLVLAFLRPSVFSQAFVGWRFVLGPNEVVVASSLVPMPSQFP